MDGKREAKEKGWREVKEGGRGKEGQRRKRATGEGEIEGNRKNEMKRCRENGSHDPKGSRSHVLQEALQVIACVKHCD